METCSQCTDGRGKSGCLKGDCHWNDRNSACDENSKYGSNFDISLSNH